MPNFKFIPSLNCTVCNKPNCDISDKTNRLYFCSEACADNKDALLEILNKELYKWRELRDLNKSLENDIRSNTDLMSQIGDYYNCLEHYLDE